MSFTFAHRLVTAAGLLLIVSGGLLALAGCIPLSTLQPLGEWIRRPEDVTPERYQRFVMAARLLGLWSIGLGALICRNRSRFSEWVAIVGGVVPTWMAVPHKQKSEWGIEVWCIFTLGVVLRLLHLDDSLAYDEAYTFLNFASRPWYEAIADYNSTNNHLFNTFCMHWCYRMFGDAEWALRLPVVIAGILTLPLTYSWAKRWRGRRVALVTTTLVAISPMMITYSADARGYMFVTAAALAFDDAAASIDANPKHRRGAWIALVLAATIGLWSMPIMVYAVLATTSWFLISAWLPNRGVRLPFALRWRDFWSRTQAMFLVGAAVVLLVGLFYTPAFVFRGLQFLSDPIMLSEPASSFLRSFAAGLWGAWLWWTEGVVPGWLWAAFVALGLIAWGSDSQRWLRLVSPFVVVVVLNLAQRVAPPPRIYLFLFPWVALIASRGAIMSFESLLGFGRSARLSGRDGKLLPARIISLAACLAGGWYAWSHPILFNVAERSNFYQFKDKMRYLFSAIGRSTTETKSHRLIAPLPCDLPALFYLNRYYLEHPGLSRPFLNSNKQEFAVNGRPEPGELVWLFAKPKETPDDVLRSPLINLGDLVDAGSLEWGNPETRGGSLWLYRANSPITAKQ